MNDIDGMPITPWSKMTPDEKTALAMETLYHHRLRVPASQASTTNPGPMPFRCIMYLQRVYAAIEKQQ